MSHADQAIRGLDNALGPVGTQQGVGEDIVLRRIVGQGKSAQNVDVIVRARVRSPNATELVAGISQSDMMVIISPTQIVQRQWPGGELPSLTVRDPKLPRRNDKLIIADRMSNIEHVDSPAVGGVVVRHNIRASG